MSYKIDLFDDRIVLLTFSSEFKLSGASPATHEVLALVDQLEPPVYCIIDARDLHISFGDLVQGLFQGTRGDAALFKSPKLRFVIVGSGAIIKTGAAALGQAQYGEVPVKVFETAEEALEHARQELAAP
jgi:hypothetical protein